MAEEHEAHVDEVDQVRRRIEQEHCDGTFKTRPKPRAPRFFREGILIAGLALAMGFGIWAITRNLLIERQYSEQEKPLDHVSRELDQAARVMDWFHEADFPSRRRYRRLDRQRVSELVERFAAAALGGMEFCSHEESRTCYLMRAGAEGEQLLAQIEDRADDQAVFLQGRKELADVFFLLNGITMTESIGPGRLLNMNRAGKEAGKT